MNSTNRPPAGFTAAGAAAAEGEAMARRSGAPQYVVTVGGIEAARGSAIHCEIAAADEQFNQADGTASLTGPIAIARIA